MISGEEAREQGLGCARGVLIWGPLFILVWVIVAMVIYTKTH